MGAIALFKEGYVNHRWINGSESIYTLNLKGQEYLNKILKYANEEFEFSTGSR